MEESIECKRQMKKKVLEYIRKYQMVSPGERICVGFSGGADSVCLLVILQELSEELGIELEAVHVNHNLRGDESDEDQSFAEEFCRYRGIPLHLYSFPVAETAKKQGTGLEEAGRSARQQAFEDCRQSFGADKIALAHHRNDSAETLLFHLARGTSLAGLTGIRPVTGDVIRPLLWAGRQEIREELGSRKISWREDSSNLSNAYTRNFIRHKVIPALEEMNSRAVEHIAAAGEDLLAAEGFLATECGKREKKYCRKTPAGDWLIDAALAEEPEFLMRKVIFSVLGKAAGSGKDLGRSHVLSVEALFRGRTGSRIRLPGKLAAVREYGGIRIGNLEERSRPAGIPLPEIPVMGPGKYLLQAGFLDCCLCKREEKIPEKKYTTWLDYDRIKNGLVLRTRKPGDYLIINRSGGRKKLKDYMIDAKIPREERDRILLLASGSQIFWVVGYRISESCKVTEETRQVMRIQITGGYTDE